MKSISQNLLTGKIYPDRSFSLGFCPKKTISTSEKKYERDLRSQPEVDTNALVDWYTGCSTIGGKFQSITAGPLFIKGAKSSQVKRGNYGSKGITKFGRRVVKNTCILLEQKFGRERLGFVTCTLPSLPEALHHRINGVWGELVRRFYQKLRRQLKKVGKPFIYVGVTEIQEKRYRRTGVPAPHLHFVYVCRSSKKSRYWIYVCQIHRAWNQAIREGISRCGYPFTMSQLPGWGSVHCKGVQKSAAAYLGKYMSKGGRVLESMKENGWTEFPRQWWTASMQCKKMFRDSIIRMDAIFAKALFYQLEHFLHDGTITWARFVDVCVSGEIRTMGLVGEFSAKAYRCISTA